MRKLTIKREKRTVGCLGVMKVYIEDATSDDLKIPVYVTEESEEYLSFRKIGELKNGEEKAFDIGEDAARVLVIADHVSKNWCNDCYQIPEGDADLYLTGRNIFSPFAGNPFRFDGNEGTDAQKNRSRGIRRGFIFLVISVLIGFAVGYGISAMIFGFLGGREKVFTTSDEMSITLTERFERQRLLGYADVFLSDDVTVFVTRDPLDSENKSYTTEDYATLLIIYNKFNTRVESDGDLCCFVASREEKDGSISRFYAYTYKTEDSFWFIQFLVDEDKADKYADDIAKWAKSVSFN